MDTNRMISIIRHVQKVSVLCFVLHIFFKIFCCLVPVREEDMGQSCCYATLMWSHLLKKSLIENFIFVQRFLNHLWGKKAFLISDGQQKKACYSIFYVPNRPVWRCKQSKQQKQRHFDTIHMAHALRGIYLHKGSFYLNLLL